MVRHFQNWRMGFAGMLVGALLSGWLLRGDQELQAEVRRATPTQSEQHFKSGGRLSEAVLQEILAVLKRMDDRLARIELNTQNATRPGTLQATPAADAGPAEGAQVPEIKVRRAK